jgi:protein-tyrosine phosphatase
MTRVLRPTSVDGADSPQQIIPGLYLGSSNDADDIAKLQRLKIGAILNCADFTQGATARFYKHYMPEVVYVGIPMEDDPDYPIERYFPFTNRFIHKHRVERRRNVLVHCQMGISRSVACVIAYLMSISGSDPWDLLINVRKRRPQAGPNPGFLDALKRWNRR